MKKQNAQHSFLRKVYYFIAFVSMVLLIWVIGMKYGNWLAESEIFRIRKIEIEGNELFSDQEIREMGKLDFEVDIWQVNLDEVRQNIGDHTFIEEVYVERLLPDAIRIRVTEKHPVALLQFEGAFFCIDKTGLILPAISGKNYDLPVLSGAFKGGVSIGSRAGGNVIGQGLRFINLVLNICPDVYPQISEVVVGKPEGLVLYTSQSAISVRLGTGEYRRKIHYLKEILVELTVKEELPQVRYIDLRFGDQVVVGIKA